MPPTALGKGTIWELYADFILGKTYEKQKGENGKYERYRKK
jgi:hypothetical protein